MTVAATVEGAQEYLARAGSNVSDHVKKRRDLTNNVVKAIISESEADKRKHWNQPIVDKLAKPFITKSPTTKPIGLPSTRHGRSDLSILRVAGSFATAVGAGAAQSAAVVGGGVGVLAVAAGALFAIRCGVPLLYKYAKRARAVSLINNGEGLPCEMQESLELIRDCAVGCYDESEYIDDPELPPPPPPAPVPPGGDDDDGGDDNGGPPPADGPAGGNGNPPPGTAGDQINPYKGDAGRTRVRRSFWISAAAHARAHFGVMAYTAANVRCVRIWIRRWVLDQTNGSIRASHLAQNIDQVTASVFVKTSSDLALEKVVQLLADSGRMKKSDAW